MSRVRRHTEVVLDRDAAERATKAARHALIMCALALEGERRRDVLFAVARSYAAAEGVLQRDGSHLADIVGVRNAQLDWKQLETAEDALCGAVQALPRLGCRAVGRLIEAAHAYSKAWELNRARRYASWRGGDERNLQRRAPGANPSRKPAPMPL